MYYCSPRSSFKQDKSYDRQSITNYPTIFLRQFQFVSPTVHFISWLCGVRLIALCLYLFGVHRYRRRLLYIKRRRGWRRIRGIRNRLKFRVGIKWRMARVRRGRLCVRRGRRYRRIKITRRGTVRIRYGRRGRRRWRKITRRRGRRRRRRRNTRRVLRRRRRRRKRRRRRQRRRRRRRRRRLRRRKRRRKRMRRVKRRRRRCVMRYQYRRVWRRVYRRPGGFRIKIGRKLKRFR